MKKTRLTRALYRGVFFVIIGAVFIVLENTLYQSINDAGALTESLFLPLGALCLLIGGLTLLAFIILKIKERL